MAECPWHLVGCMHLAGALWMGDLKGAREHQGLGSWGGQWSVLDPVDCAIPVLSGGMWKGLETRGWKEMCRGQNGKDT